VFIALKRAEDAPFVVWETPRRPLNDDSTTPLASLTANLTDGASGVEPSVATGADPSTLVTLPMTHDEVAEWLQRIQQAEQRTKAYADKWDVLIKEYLPVVESTGAAEAVKVNLHFRNVHTKLGQLFYRNPDLQLTPRGIGLVTQQSVDPQTGMPVILTMEDVVTIKQEVLNLKLGREGINATRLVDELLFDVLAWSGIGICKVGYDVVLKPVQQPRLVPAPFDPLNPPQPGVPPQMVPAVDPLTGQPVMDTIQVPIWEDWYCRRISPKKYLCSGDLHSTRYDEDAAWQGHKFYMRPKQARQKFGLTEDEVGKATKDDKLAEYDEDKQSGDDDRMGLVCGTEIFCKASLFTDERHPQAINQLVFIDGINDRPVVWRPSPDQEFDAQGKLTEDSMLGNPLTPLTIRDLADSPFPQSDAAFTNSQVKQINTHARQSVLLRDAAIGKYLVDAGAFEDGEIDQLKNAGVGEYIKVAEGRLEKGVGALCAPTAQLHATPDDYRTVAAQKQALDETLGISSNSAGSTEETVRTATEIASVATAVASRNEKEQSRVIDFYLTVARKIDALLMRYATEDDYVHIAGPAGAKKIALWNNQIISGRFLYDIKPDSQLRIDTAKDRQQNLNFYNLVAQDPMVNRTVILKRLARQFGYDPSQIVLDPALMAMQPPHGGPGETVNDHEAAKSGGTQNAPGASNHRDEQAGGGAPHPPTPQQKVM